MIAAWMVYAIVIAGWVCLGALAAERAAQALGMPTRWTWSAATAAAAGLPLLRLFGIRAAPWSSVEVGPVAVTTEVAQLGEIASRPAFLSAQGMAFLDRPLAGVWIVATAALGVWLLTLSARLARESRAWPLRLVGGRVVRVAPDTGPAVIGLLHGIIVLPRWIDDLPAADQAAVVRHEVEHLRCGDNAVILGTLAGAVLMPWNLALWWILRRLRQAVEFDCDRRVVAAGVNRLQYGRLLLEVSHRRTRPRVLVTALSPGVSLLSRRIKMLEPTTSRFRALRLGGALSVAGLMAVAACETPAPPALTDAPSADADAPAVLERAPRRLSGPALRYPTMLRQAGIEGEVVLGFTVHPDGRVDEESIEIVSSTNRAFEGPARHTIAGTVFEPALANGEPVAAAVQQRVAFVLTGSEPNSEADLTVRGRGEETVQIEGTGKVLVYVDGIRVAILESPLTLGPGGRIGAALEDLNPDDIERIEVLKGAAAAAQFGPEAAAGVIQIFMKSGR